MGEIADPLFRLSQVTEAMGEALKLLTPEERLTSDRAVKVVLQGVIDGLKVLDARRAPASPND